MFSKKQIVKATLPQLRSDLQTFSFEPAKPDKRSYSCRLLKNNTQFVYKTKDVKINIKPASCEIYIQLTEPDIIVINDISEVFAFYKNKKIVYNQNSFRVTITKETEIYDSENTKGSIEDLIPCEVIGAVEMIFHSFHNLNNTFLLVRATKIHITNDETAKTEKYVDLPPLDKFKNMKLDEVRCYYTNSKICSEEQNSIVGYVLFEYEPNSYRIVSLEDFEVNNYGTCVYPKGKNEKLIFSDNGMDNNGYEYHYVITMKDKKYKTRTPKEFMSSIRKFLFKRAIDVRGLWYAVEDETKHSLAKIHVVSGLTEKFVDALFWEWIRKGGKVSTKYLKEPIGWRIIASRNHMLLYNPETKIRTSAETFYEAMNILTIKYNIKNMPSREEIISIMKMKLYEI